MMRDQVGDFQMVWKKTSVVILYLQLFCNFEIVSK